MLDKGQIQDWDGDPDKKVSSTGLQGVAGRIMEGREAVATGERVILTPEQVQARRRRGQWLALALFAFVIIVFVLTMSKVGGGLPERM